MRMDCIAREGIEMLESFDEDDDDDDDEDDEEEEGRGSSERFHSSRRN